jgi:hypothetical protein
MCGGSRPSMLKKKNPYPRTLRRVGTAQVYPVGWASDWHSRDEEFAAADSRAERQRRNHTHIHLPTP